MLKLGIAGPHFQKGTARMTGPPPISEIAGRKSSALLSLPFFIMLSSGIGNTTFLVPPFSHTLGINRISKFYLSLFLQDFTPNNPQGIACAKMNEEDNPKTSTDDHILTIFAVNSGTGEILYNFGLKDLKVFKADLKNPQGIAVNEQGAVYVADTDNDRIVKLQYQKGNLSLNSEFGIAAPSGSRKCGIQNSELKKPRGVGLDSKNRIYITDTENHRILIVDSLGNILTEWRQDLELPSGIGVIDKDARDNKFSEEFLVVIDKENRRLSKFNLAGRLLSQITCRAIGLEEADFSYVAIDYFANIYVTDRLNNSIHKFDRDLNYIISFGNRGDERLDSPRGIAIGRRFGQVFLTEREGGRYLFLGLDGFIIGCFPQEFSRERPGTTIGLYLTEISEVKISIFLKERLIRDLTPAHYQKSGEVLIVWDGLDNAGNLVSEGEYRIKVVLRPTYSAPKRYFKKELETTVRMVAAENRERGERSRNGG